LTIGAALARSSDGDGLLAEASLLK